MLKLELLILEFFEIGKTVGVVVVEHEAVLLKLFQHLLFHVVFNLFFHTALHNWLELAQDFVHKTLVVQAEILLVVVVK